MFKTPKNNLRTVANYFLVAQRTTALIEISIPIFVASVRNFVGRTVSAVEIGRVEVTFMKNRKVLK